MGSPVIWAGTTAKSLKDTLNLNDESLIGNGEFSLSNNTSNASVTGLLLDPSTVRSAEIVIGVSIDATTDLFETFKLLVINKGGTSFDMSQTSVGDASLVSFDITSLGQIRVTTSNYSGFSSGVLKFTYTIVYI